MTELILYMKPTCHLCHNAAALLQTLQADFPFSVKEIDILQDAAAYEKHWEYIPVVEVNGRIILSAPISEESACKALLELQREGVLG